MTTTTPAQELRAFANSLVHMCQEIILHNPYGYDKLQIAAALRLLVSAAYVEADVTAKPEWSATSADELRFALNEFAECRDGWELRAKEAA